MNLIRLSLLTPMLIALSACGGNQSCHKPQLYQSAQQGERIAVPDDLDELQVRKEMTIPEPSPRPPRPEGGDCIDAPPTFGSSSN
jgi:hypothetical protein